jgi:hypothetical protein
MQSIKPLQQNIKYVKFGGFDLSDELILLLSNKLPSIEMMLYTIGNAQN